MKGNDGLHPKKYFYAKDGTIIKDYEDLFQELQDMPEHVFRHHVNDEKNDFYHWIKDVFGDRGLARRIKHADEKEEILKHVFVSLFR